VHCCDTVSGNNSYFGVLSNMNSLTNRLQEELVLHEQLCRYECKTEDQAKLREPAAAVVGADVHGSGVLAVGGPVVGAGVGGAAHAIRKEPTCLVQHAV
jgi:hypothetical protein